jgi:DNA modification methylase
MAKPTKPPTPNPLTARRPDLPLSLVPTQTIFCGDNLDKLRQLPEDCVDLVYIDPPFNSNRNYEVFWPEAREKRAFEDRHASTQAYIQFMRPRCAELARVLRKTGSFYYHCDWHASHYVKVMLDQVFGENQFRNEIVWKRSDAHSDTKQGARHYGRVHDVILFYSKGDHPTFNPIHLPLSRETADKWYRYVEPETGRRYNKADVTGPGGAAKGNPCYEWKGVTRYWRYSREKMEELDAAGRLVYSKSGMPYQKRYLDESKGVAIQDWWDDIGMLRGISRSGERLGYPTQKPVALLERIIKVSSNPDDIVLDAFCGCGTALVAAQRLDRRWIGIDISPTACRVMAERLVRECKLREGADFFVRDLPRSEQQLRGMPFFEFQNWAVVALGGIPNKTKSKDMGIDGKIYPVGALPKPGRAEGEFDFMGVWYPVQVKQKDKAGRPDIDAFEAVMMREDRAKGFFVSFAFTADALTEISAFFRREHRTIIPLTVREILEEEIAQKLA